MMMTCSGFLPNRRSLYDNASHLLAGLAVANNELAAPVGIKIMRSAPFVFRYPGYGRMILYIFLYLIQFKWLFIRIIEKNKFFSCQFICPYFFCLTFFFQPLRPSLYILHGKCQVP
jgi:hypothetical protein